jgi:hypothetical protein
VRTRNRVFLLLAVLLAIAVLVVVSPRPGTWLTQRSLVGAWREPAAPMGTVPSVRMLYFNSDGTGSTNVQVDVAEVPGMARPFGFTYAVDGDRVELKYTEGGSDTLEIDSFSLVRVRSTPVGSSKFASGGTWTRRLGW